MLFYFSQDDERPLMNVAHGRHRETTVDNRDTEHSWTLKGKLSVVFICEGLADHTLTLSGAVTAYASLRGQLLLKSTHF